MDGELGQEAASVAQTLAHKGDLDGCVKAEGVSLHPTRDGLRSYIAEPKRGRRRWEEKHTERDGTYSNRRRMKAERGKELMCRRGELIGRCFAHCLEMGRMRRVHLRGRVNILKRDLVHVAAFNLSLVMRFLIGVGTPRGLQNGLRGFAAAVCARVQLWIHLVDRQTRRAGHRLGIRPDPVAA